MSEIPFAVTAPVSVGRVSLRARDGSLLADYYKKILGLGELRRSGNAVGLGVEGRELLEIEESPSLRPDDPRSAGLFHTAFLLPSRRDLANWMRFAATERLPVDGASDHIVSEAFYLTDPEGNGLEIYADRPEQGWTWQGGEVAMATARLDLRALADSVPEGDPGWQGAPPASVVGHVHLRVGDVPTAESFWRERMGFDAVNHYGDGAVFLSTGGYHHHIAGNIWASRGAGPREADRTGLGFVELLSREAGEETVLHDPWGTEIRVLPKAA